MTAVALLPLLALLLVTPAQAAPPTLLFLIDASPSMGGALATPAVGAGWWRTLLVHAYGLDPPPLAARAKLGVVQQAVARYAAHLEAGTVVGLRVFGQRRWLGCEDSQLLLPLAPLARERLAAILAQLQPSPAGNTPLAHALKEAVRDLLALPAGGTTHIVLITDAADLCPEPLPAGGHLTRETGVVAAIDVIALGLTAAAAEPLVVVSSATEGHLYRASDATTVEIALRRCLPLTPRQRLATLLHLHPGGWPMAVAAVVLLLLAVVAWALVRSER